MTQRVFIFAALAALVCSLWTAAPARSQSMFAGLPVDGITCDTSEGAAEHIHAHLQIFNRGKAIEVPGNIGIPEGAGCLYWLHTHSADGMIHIEAPVTRPFTLGQFFDIWGQTLSRTRAASLTAPRGRTLRVTLNGKIWTKDPRSVPLRDREEIVIQYGPPFVAGHSADWSRM